MMSKTKVTTARGMRSLPPCLLVVIFVTSSVAATNDKLAFVSKGQVIPGSAGQSGGVEGDNDGDAEQTVPRMIRMKAGMDVVLECEAMSRTGPTIHWLYRGQPIIQDPNKISNEDSLVYESSDNDDIATPLRASSTKSRLFIGCIKPRDAGKYACVADTPTTRISSMQRLLVDSNSNTQCEQDGQNYDGARIYMWTTRRLDLEGNDVQLICRATGSPSPKIVWYDRDNKLINPSGDQYKLLESGDLVIKKASWAHNMGLYRCVADNGLGADETSTFLYLAGRTAKDEVKRGNDLSQ